MPITHKLSNTDAREIVLKSQGLKSNFKNPYEVISQLGYVQIDTISVIERAHNHVFFSRLNSYNPSDLNQLMATKEVFEYWSHAAAYLPISDYSFSLFVKNQYAKGKKHWFEQDKKMMRHVLKRIKEEGPLQSKDFEHKGDKGNPWYAWKPAKMALTELFMQGKLMVSERKGFQKVFDLTERVLPDHVYMTIPSKSSFCRYVINRAIHSHGIIAEKEMTYLRTGLQPAFKNTLKQMLGKGEVDLVQIEENDSVYYSSSEIIESLDENRNDVHILSPFDNLVIQRNRLSEIFNFDYQIECYVPEKKRKFGYFSLPILYGNKFVGRLDPKAHKKTAVFEIKNCWFENGFSPSEEFLSKLTIEIRELAVFCSSSIITTKRGNNPLDQFSAQDLIS